MYGFCFTLNNYTSSHCVDIIDACKQRRFGITYVVFGFEEAPTTGTPHLQGYFQSKSKNMERLSTVFHCKVTRQIATADKARNYCMKDSDCCEEGTFDNTVLGSRQGARSDVDEIQKAIDDGMSYDDICDKFFQQSARISKFIKERVHARDQKNAFDALSAELEGCILRPWQNECLALVDGNPNSRLVHWYWESTGNVGKSWMATYLAMMRNALVLEPGKKMDLAFIYKDRQTPIVVFDLSRTHAPDPDSSHAPLDAVYSFIESLSTGRMVSTKYESTTFFFNKPIVLVFANFKPDRSKLSSDRWNVIVL